MIDVWFYVFIGGKMLVSLVYCIDMVVGMYCVVFKVVVVNSDVVFVGYGIIVFEKGWDDYVGIDVCGKIVVIFINDVDW